MQVKMRTGYASPAGTCGPGQVIDVPDEEAEALINGGYAEAVGGCTPPVIEQAPEPEVATVEPKIERAVRKRGRPRKAKKEVDD